jgi:hypothetical protein
MRWMCCWRGCSARVAQATDRVAHSLRRPLSAYSGGLPADHQLLCILRADAEWSHWELSRCRCGGAALSSSGAAAWACTARRSLRWWPAGGKYGKGGSGLPGVYR